jgi:hypothetical protein
MLKDGLKEHEEDGDIGIRYIPRAAESVSRNMRKA